MRNASGHQRKVKMSGSEKKVKKKTCHISSIKRVTKTLFTWTGGLRFSGVSFFCLVSPRAWKQKKPTPLDRGPPLYVNRP